MNKIDKIKNRLEKFALDRDWHRYHSPKNLSMALSKEAAELLEEFQWLTEDESRNPGPEKLARIKDEIGDVLICLLQLASKLNIDVIKAAEIKIVKNAKKYPVDKSKGNAKKYTEF